MTLRLTLLATVVMMAVGTAANAQAQPKNPIPPGFIVSPMARATIFVRNQDESLKLYRDILGLRVRRDARFDDERFNKVQGTNKLGIKVNILQSGDVVYGNVGLFELKGDDRAKVPQPATGTSVVTGDIAVVFMTSDIMGITAKLRAAGYVIISEPMVLFPNDTMAVQPLEMLFRDRDGILVNLIQAGRKKGE